MVHFFRAEKTLMGCNQAWPSLGKHHCFLASEMDHGMPQQNPAGPCCIRWQRFARKLTLPTLRHRLCRHYYPSRSFIVSAWTRTWLTSYPCIVHPFSALALAWQTFILFIWTFLLITRPYIFAFASQNHLELMGNGAETSVDSILLDLSLICSAILLLNILMNFFTGFTGYPGKKSVELRYPEIVRNYVWTYFLFDLVDAFPITTFVYILDHLDRSWMLIHFIQFVRARTFYVYALNFSHLLHLDEFYVKILRYFVAGIVLIHWLTCIMHIVPVLIDDRMISEHQKQSTWENYVTALNKVTMHFFLGKRSVEQDDLIPLIVTMIIGSIFKVVVVVHLLQQLRSHERTAINFNSFLRDVSKYVTTNKVPDNTHQRIKLYIEHKYQGKFYSEDEFTLHLSEHLRHEIFLHCSGHLICTMQLCKNLSRQVIGELLMSLEPMFYLPGDVLFTFGNISEGLYFISYGKIAAYTEGGNEVTHFSDGDVLGVLGHNIERHVWTVVAIEATEAFLWRHSEIQRLTSRHEDLRHFLRIEFLKRYAQFVNLAQQKRLTKFTGPNTNIIMQLTDKKILESRQLRVETEEDKETEVEVARMNAFSSSQFYKLMRLQTTSNNKQGKR